MPATKPITRFTYAQKQLARLLLTDLSMLEIAVEMFQRPDWVESTAKELYNSFRTFSRAAYVVAAKKSHNWSRISDHPTPWPSYVPLPVPEPVPAASQKPDIEEPEETYKRLREAGLSESKPISLEPVTIQLAPRRPVPPGQRPGLLLTLTGRSKGVFLTAKLAREPRQQMAPVTVASPNPDIALLRQSFGHPDSFGEYQRLLALNTKQAETNYQVAKTINTGLENIARLIRRRRKAPGNILKVIEE